MHTPRNKPTLGVAIATSILAAPLSHGVLVAHWTFDDADIVGTKGAADVVGSADLTPTGASGGSDITTGQTGIFGEAYQFTKTTGGSNISDPTLVENLLRTSNPGPQGTGEVTISAWFSQTTANGQNKMFGYGGTNVDSNGSTGEALDISLEGGGIRLRLSSGNITYGSGFDFDGVDAGWHHVAVRVNSGATTYADVDIFLDGTLLSASAGTANLSDTIAIPASAFGVGGIGYDAFLQNGFTGLLDEIQIHDNALTNTQIQALSVPEPGYAFLGLIGAAGFVLRRPRRH